MIFENINELTVILAIILLCIWVFFSWKNYFKNKNMLLIILFLLSIFSIIIALFSPRYWDYYKVLDIQGWKVVFVLDVSKSMDVYDILNNQGKISRLRAQKWIISEYIKDNTQNQYSLFAFAGETLEILPYTSDIWLFQTILYWIDKGNISKYGSEFVWLFQILWNFVNREENSGTIIIFTDWWEDSKISIKQSILQKINKHNSKVIIIWLWTEQGWYIIEWQDIFGRALYKSYLWERVVSKLNKQVLQDFSSKYSFDYYTINNLDDLEYLFKSISENISQTIIQKNISLKRDISYMFIIGFVLFFISFLVFENIIWRKK